MRDPLYAFSVSRNLTAYDRRARLTAARVIAVLDELPYGATGKIVREDVPAPLANPVDG